RTGDGAGASDEHAGWRGRGSAGEVQPPRGRDRARARQAQRDRADDRQRPPAPVRADLLAPGWGGGGGDSRRHLSGLPDARTAPALQRDPAQPECDSLPELPADSLLAVRRRRGEQIASTCPPEEVEHPPATTWREESPDSAGQGGR